MARTVSDAKIGSPTARAKLKVSAVPYWRAIDPELYIAYHKNSNGGKSVARWYVRNLNPSAGNARARPTSTQAARLTSM